MIKLKKPNFAKGSSFGSSAIFFLRPAAFRPLLTKGLALSGKQLYRKFNSISKGVLSQYTQGLILG
jgi:hypothetical protein